VYLTLRGRYGARSTRADPADENSTVMYVAAPIVDRSEGRDRIVGVLTVAKPNQTIAPFIARSQGTILRWGLVLLGTALVVGLLAAWWLSRQLGALRTYADAATAGERVAPPEVPGEFGDLSRALETMRDRLEGKQYVERYVHALTHELKSRSRRSAAAPNSWSRAAMRCRPQTARGSSPPSVRRATDGRDDRQDARAGRGRAPAAHRGAAAGRPAGHDRRGGRTRRSQARATADRRARRGRDRHRAGRRVPAAPGAREPVRQRGGFRAEGSTVSVGIARDGARWRISVADEGPGVPDYALERAFERFYSLPRPGGGSRSSGLGLCFAAEAVALHGGEARLANRPGGGAVATLLLPA